MKKPLEEVLKKATDGPWSVGRLDRETVVAGHCVADCCPDFCPPYSQRKPNAALIAHFRNLGPELVEALHRLLLAVESITAHEAGVTRDELVERLHMDDSSVLRQARALLSRAKEVEVP